MASYLSFPAFLFLCWIFYCIIKEHFLLSQFFILAANLFWLLIRTY